VNKAKAGFEYLSKLTPWNGRGGFALDPVANVLDRLNNPQDALPIVHIAGTNGKGSVSAAIASILGRAGYRVGLNTSPHLQSLNERVIVDGLPIDTSTMGELAYDIRSATAKGADELSFHEAITALSFLAFRELGVEWGVVEVGLGGRLDASNVISRPAATAIVTIDFDHQHILGETIAQIAAEKAGIIKPGVPLVSGSLPFEADRVVAKKAAGVPHYRYGSEYGVSSLPDLGERTFGYWGKDLPFTNRTSFEFASPLPGVHQGHNLALAATLGLVIGINEIFVREGIQGVYWPARLEKVDVDGVRIIMDCAHNPAGIRSFVEFLKSCGEATIDLTFGVLDTKNWKEMIKILLPHVRHWRLIRPESERALPLEVVGDEIRLSGNEIRISFYGSDYDRLVKDLLKDTDGESRYLAGSMYMIGKVRDHLGLPIKPLWHRVEK